MAQWVDVQAERPEFKALVLTATSACNPGKARRVSGSC